MTRTPSFLALALLASTFAACDGSNGNDATVPDGGEDVSDLGTDSPPGDTFDIDSAFDVPDGFDATGDPADDGDAAVYNPCALPFNLVAPIPDGGNVGASGDAGPLTWIATWSSSNATTPAGAPIAAPSCALSVGHEVMARYVMNRDGYLTVSTAEPGTMTNLDTVVWALDHCDAPVVTELGCSDDVTGARSSRFTTGLQTAGSEVFIVIAGVSPPRSSALVETGGFQLRVTETPPTPEGGRCDLAGPNVCAAMLRCAVAESPDVARCRRGVADGAPCDPVEVVSVCMAGSHCLGDPLPVCVRDGIRGAACRVFGVPCDADLVCSGLPGTILARCVQGRTLGQTCDPSGVADRCVAPLECRLAGTIFACANPPGYLESVLMSPAFLDACAGDGQRLTLMGTGRDDAHSSLPVHIAFDPDDAGMGHLFTFFGEVKREVWVSTNGYLLFGGAPPGDLTGGHGALPSMDEGDVVAAFWDDLALREAPGSDLCVRTLGTAPMRQFVVEWLDVQRAGHTDTHLTFEVVLNEQGSTIDVLYRTLDPSSGTEAAWADGSHAAIGLQGSSGSYTQVHAGTVSTTTGLRFTPR